MMFMNINDSEGYNCLSTEMQERMLRGKNPYDLEQKDKCSEGRARPSTMAC